MWKLCFMHRAHDGKILFKLSEVEQNQSNMHLLLGDKSEQSVFSLLVVWTLQTLVQSITATRHLSERDKKSTSPSVLTEQLYREFTSL